MKVSSFRFVFSHRQEKVKPSKCSKNALGSSSPGIWINFKAGRAESCSCSFRPPAGVDPGGRIGGASGQLRGADVGACAAAVIFLLRARVFSVQQLVIFFFFFLLLSVRQKARGRRRKRKTLSLFVSFESHVLPVLRRQAVDLLLHRGRGLLRRVQCEVRKRKREKNAANDERLFEDLTERRRYLGMHQRLPNAPCFRTPRLPPLL